MKVTRTKIRWRRNFLMRESSPQIMSPQVYCHLFFVYLYKFCWYWWWWNSQILRSRWSLTCFPILGRYDKPLGFLPVLTAEIVAVSATVLTMPTENSATARLDTLRKLRYSLNEACGHHCSVNWRFLISMKITRNKVN